MTRDKAKTPAAKRARHFRDVTQTAEFLKEWDSIEASGKHNMHRLKEAMMLLIANDAPLPPEWKDHRLKGDYGDVRECHAKGDLLLMYQIATDVEEVIFLRAGTHSELLS